MGIQVQAPNPAVVNAQAGNLVKAVAVKRTQQIYQRTIADPSAEPFVTVNPRNVGLCLGFYVHVSATMTNANGAGDAGAIDATDFASSNMLSRISLVDLENNERINCSGRYLEMITSLKARRPFGAAILTTADDATVNYGKNWTVNAAAQIASGGTQTWQHWYYVPCSYSQNDLRGAMYLNVVNANAQLTLTFNPTPFADAPTDDTNYCGTGNTGTMTAITVTVYQVYLDQLPRDTNGSVILPVQDLATVYELKETVYTALVQDVENPFDVPNFRDFLSLTPIYFNGTARSVTDTAYWLLQTANFTSIWKKEPALIALETRNHLGYDLPKGCFYFGSRNKPIATVQYGNVQLVLNPSTCGAGATVRLGYEDFALKNVVTKAGSIR